MKKIYSKLAVLSAFLLFGSASIAQTCVDGENFAGFEKRDDGINPPVCEIRVITRSADWVGGTVRLYAGALDVTPPGPQIILAATGINKGFALIRFDCAYFETITYVEIEKNGNKCQAVEGSRIVLPIILKSFNANLKGSAVELKWVSEQESKSSHFEIERSNDGKTFASLGKVAAAGISNKPLSYQFTDNSFPGTGYYRLKMVDIDGKFEYSKTIYVNGGSGSTNGVLSVFPNPFRSDVQLRGVNASDVNKNNIRVFSATGKEVGFKVTGANSISIDGSAPSGVYILSVGGVPYKLMKQ